MAVRAVAARAVVERAAVERAVGAWGERAALVLRGGGRRDSQGSAEVLGAWHLCGRVVCSVHSSSTCRVHGAGMCIMPVAGMVRRGTWCGGAHDAEGHMVRGVHGAGVGRRVHPIRRQRT